jgi:hypothetical protein
MKDQCQQASGKKRDMSTQLLVDESDAFYRQLIPENINEYSNTHLKPTATMAIGMILRWILT